MRPVWATLLLAIGGIGLEYGSVYASPNPATVELLQLAAPIPVLVVAYGYFFAAPTYRHCELFTRLLIAVATLGVCAALGKFLGPAASVLGVLLVWAILLPRLQHNLRQLRRL